jgi:hypothetical protein
MMSTSALLLQSGSERLSGAVFGGTWILLWLAAGAVIIVGGWRVFEKAGQPGWAIVVPIQRVCHVESCRQAWMVAAPLPYSLGQPHYRHCRGHRYCQSFRTKRRVRLFPALPLVWHRLPDSWLRRLRISRSAGCCVNRVPEDSSEQPVTQADGPQHEDILQLHLAYVRVCSICKRAFFRSIPQRYPLSFPSCRTTRWHGIATATGFVAHALATARQALACPIAFATSR